MRSNSLMLMAALGTLTVVGIYAARGDEGSSKTLGVATQTEPHADAGSARELGRNTAPATREEVERRGADALAYVLGGGGVDDVEADRDEEAFPRPETLEDAQARFGDRLKEVEEALATGQELDAEQRQKLRQGVSLALSDLTAHLDLATTDGKDAYVEARSSARGALLGLGPSKLAHREELLATHRGDGGESPSPGGMPMPLQPTEEPAGEDPAAEDETPDEVSEDEPEDDLDIDTEE